MSDYRILVTGSRHRGGSSITAALEDALFEAGGSRRRVIVVHGGATGADETADLWADTRGLQIETHPADWAGRGKAAGPERNQRMVDLGADICLAFPAPDSRGTWDCIRRAVAAGIETRIHPEPTT